MKNYKLSDIVFHKYGISNLIKLNINQEKKEYLTN